AASGDGPCWLVDTRRPSQGPRNGSARVRAGCVSGATPKPRGPLGLWELRCESDSDAAHALGRDRAARSDALCDPPRVTDGIATELASSKPRQTIGPLVEAEGAMHRHRRVECTDGRLHKTHLPLEGVDQL